MLKKPEGPYTPPNWAKNFPRVCPFCGEVFMAYAPQPWPSDWIPNREDTKLDWDGHRETCSHPDCIEEAKKEHYAWCDVQYEERAKRAALLKASQENDDKMRQIEEERRWK